VTPGKVWLVGAGPGDPGLITVRGKDVLAEADVVLYDALSHPALLELCPRAEKRNVGKRFGERSADQEHITSQLIELARAGRNVARLKGGDPLLFARGGEEALALAEAGIEFEIVPGISSPVAASAYAGISLTHRELSSSVTFITGSDRAGVEWSPESWKKLATATDTMCILMGMRRLDAITRALMDGGRAPETPVAVIQWGARPAQRTLTGTLSGIAAAAKQAGLTNPAVVVVGEVVRLREHLRWYDSRPLFGRRVLVPRPVEQGKHTAMAVRARGAEPVLEPLIRIAPPPDAERLRRAVLEASTYDWVVFTSANGVERFFAALREVSRDARAFGSARVAAIGPKTAAELETRGVVADLVAKDFVGEGLARDLLAMGPAGRVLVARALVARDVLPDALRAAGAEVDVVAAYETLPADEAGASLRRRLDGGELDVVLLTSSSTVSELVARLGRDAATLLSRVTLASIGPVTTKTAEDLGLRVDVTADVYTVDGLLDALERHFLGASQHLREGLALPSV
jgi:uroporphyrinogen III methyltransferase/synthase